LNLHDFTAVRKLQETDRAVKVWFCNRFCETACSGGICLLAVYFVDETWFYLNGHMRTQSDTYRLDNEYEKGISLYHLTLNLPTTSIVAQPFNVIKWQLKFNPVA